MKRYLKLLALVLCMLTPLVFVGCNNDKDEPEENVSENTIAGKWIHKNIDVGTDYTIYFGKGNSGWMNWSDTDETIDFVYQIHNNQILFNAEGDSWKCEFEFRGKSLVIYGNPWGEEDDIDLLYLERVK